jgi:transcriptional regulator with XRE-family HTH domain
MCSALVWTNDGTEIRTRQALGAKIRMSTMGERLKEERERLKMTVLEFAEVAGAKKNTVIDWQKNVSSPPAAKLEALAKRGLDVLYVVTGVRADAIPVPKIEPMSKREQALIANYRNSTEEGKRALEGVASATAHMDRGEKRQGGE